MLVPDYLEGVITEEGGLVKVREALIAAKNLSTKYGATLRYNQNVINIDHEAGVVTMENGQKFKGK